MKITSQILSALLLISLFTATGYGQTIPTYADTSAQGIVVAAHPDAAAAGVAILEQGGNAVDAAVAIAFVIGVVEPHASGLGGGGAMLLYEKDKSEFHYIDYYMKTSSQVQDSVFKRKDTFTARSICVPGTPAGLLKAHDLYGKLPLAKVMGPAIEIARCGIIVDEYFAGAILDKLDVIMQYPATSEIFFNNEFPPADGDTLKNPGLVGVLEGLRDEGADYFYDSPFTDLLIRDIQESGGILVREDFSSYQARLREPLVSDYKGYDIISAPAPQSGSTLLEIMNIYEQAKVPKRCFNKRNDRWIHVLAEAIVRADVDRFHYLADPGSFNVPQAGLISDEYAETRLKDIRKRRRKYTNSKDILPGNPNEFGILKSGMKRGKQTRSDAPHTTHISVTDADGNAVSMTQTLGYFFGSGFSSQGVLFNSSMTNFYRRPSPNTLAPDKRPLTTISPTMVFRGNKLRIVIGTPGGGRIFNVLAQMLIRLLDFHQTPIEAMNAPRFSLRRSQNDLNYEEGLDEKSLKKLAKMGYTFNKHGRYDNYFGGVQLIVYDKAIGKYIGVSDPRRNGRAKGLE